MVKQNAEELVDKFLFAARAVQESIYVDDGLTGANDIPTMGTAAETILLCWFRVEEV